MYRNKKIYISSEDLSSNLENILKRYIIKGKAGIHTELSDHYYNILQNEIIKLFGGGNKIKFVTCSLKAKGVI